jgi:NADPH:quinone reductase-like Zn-dependent oxidoreductase
MDLLILIHRLVLAAKVSKQQRHYAGNFDTLTGVGHVRSIGKNVTQFAVGQRVAFFSHIGKITY